MHCGWIVARVQRALRDAGVQAGDPWRASCQIFRKRRSRCSARRALARRGRRRRRILACRRAGPLHANRAESAVRRAATSTTVKPSIPVTRCGIAARMLSVERVVWGEYIDDHPVQGGAAPPRPRPGSATVDRGGAAPRETPWHDFLPTTPPSQASSASRLTIRWDRLFERHYWPAQVHGAWRRRNTLQHVKEHVLHSDVRDGDRVFISPPPAG